VGDPSDEAVWRLVLAGDDRQYGLVWDRHHARIFHHLIGSGHTPSAAEDLTAATFLELWRRRGGVRFVDGSLLPWLIVTAQNVSRNASRARRRYEKFLSALPAPSPTPDPAEVFSERNEERVLALREAIAAARPADAVLLAMTALEGFTIREAATALGLSESAAKMRLSRVRARLRNAVAVHALPEGGTS
jgi:RNA polymerase sigma factor (sigma-70 family)